MRLELTLPALERLIGGDTEMELNLRKQIVEEFSRRYLKDVAESAACSIAVEEAKRHVNALAKEHFGISQVVDNLWPTIDSRLKAMIESLVQAHAQKAVDAALLNIIEYQKRYWGKEIEAAVKKAMDRQIEKEIEDGIRLRLEAAAKSVR